MGQIVLVINPGSTSTKLAAFQNQHLLAQETLSHSVEELKVFQSIAEQKEYRMAMIQEFIDTHQLAEELVAVVGRGGLLKPIPGGTYLVDDAMLQDLTAEKYGTHASNLGAILAASFAKKYQVPAYIVDPVVVDELLPLARLSGIKEISRRSVAHVLNQRAVARKLLSQAGKRYEESNVVVAHLGGGISIGAHQHGKLIDVFNGLDGEGPYTPERSGSLPLIDFAHFILENHLSISAIKRLIAGEGGLRSYLGETDIRKITAKIEQNDATSKKYLDGMCYQLGKAIAEMAAVLKGNIDSIIITGGMAHSAYVLQELQPYIAWIADVQVYPGEMEMRALYEGVLRVLNKEEPALIYENVGVED